MNWCEQPAGSSALPSKEARLAAVKELAALNLPVGAPEEMERESVARVEPLS